MKTYTPLHCHSDMSLLDGVSQPMHIADRIEELGLNACAITDHSGVSHSIKFFNAMKEKNKKAILGNEFYVCSGNVNDKTKENRQLAHQVIVAKNKAGWQNLVELTSMSNRPDNFYYKPRIDFNLMKEFASSGNFISFSGHLNSTLANAIIEDGKIIPEWKVVGSRWALYLQEIFGKGNFFIEIQMIDMNSLPLAKALGTALREIGKSTGIPCVATPDAHYISKDRAIDQRVLLCRGLNKTFNSINSHSESNGIMHFFKSNNYHIPSYEEMLLVNTEEELDNTNLIADLCEAYSVTGRPILPKLVGDNGQDEDEYLRHLCREGWSKKIKDKIPKSEHQVYADRIKFELEVLQCAGLSSYFLILADVLRYIRSNGWLPGPGRGSSSGSLTAYLTGITSVNPIPYDLLFERFYNAGRNTKDKVSYPDIDTDVPISKRDKIVKYIQDKYGHDKVGQIATYQTIKGRGAVKTVLGAYGNHSFAEMNKITEFFPDEAKIADDLNDMKEEEGESSIIKWVLENEPEKISAYCTLKDDGTLDGPLANEIAQAIRLEKTKISQGKHPAGIVVCAEKLEKVCPMIYDGQTGSQIIGYDMIDAEAAGLIKFDILGLNALDKLMTISELLEKGESSYE